MRVLCVCMRAFVSACFKRQCVGETTRTRKLGQGEEARRRSSPVPLLSECRGATNNPSACKQGRAIRSPRASVLNMHAHTEDYANGLRHRVCRYRHERLLLCVRACEQRDGKCGGGVSKVNGQGAKAKTRKGKKKKRRGDNVTNGSVSSVSEGARKGILIGMAEE